ncbi:hypothetical protein [Clostridium beijerinckii]|uniref:hypothetical protein n=1 Tax=Clostridium beijerinckii TaxID=1520 RepID=UPI001A9B4AD4|nr:hypothetical protein [Clostridium beijerinckii]
MISAKAQHGKDTFANMLKDRLEAKGNKIVIDHFAKYIKICLKNIITGMELLRIKRYVKITMDWN